MSASPERCIAGADGQPWPCRSAWLLAFRTSSRARSYVVRLRLLDCTSTGSLVDVGDTPLFWLQPA
jgi:hypothetical protein